MGKKWRMGGKRNLAPRELAVNWGEDMAKKIIIGVVFSLLLTWFFWRLAAFLSLGREIDDIVFLGSPLLAIIISILLVRSKLMTSNNASQDTDA